MHGAHPDLRFGIDDLVIFRIGDGRLAERWAGWNPGFAPAPG